MLHITFKLFTLFIGLIATLCIIPKSSAQVFNDDFTNQDLTQNPEWVGDIDSLTFIDVGGNTMLRLNASVAGNSTILTENTTAYGSWEFFFNADFSTLSNSNRLFVYLVRNDINPESNVYNGYGLSIGKNGSDDVIELYRIDNGSFSQLITSDTVNVNNGGEYQVRVDRDTDGNWEIFVAKGYGSLPISGGTGYDNTYKTSRAFGFTFIYTTTRVDKFYIDDVIQTATAPFILDISAGDNSKIELTISNPIDNNSLEVSNFSINGLGNPSQINLIEPNKIELKFTTIPSGTLILEYSGIVDIYGSTLPAGDFTFEVFDSYTAGDILINEFMYDQPTGLDEYVELINTTSKRLLLHRWFIRDNNSTNYSLPDSTILNPDGFLVLSKDTTVLYNQFGSRSYVQMSMPTLNNTTPDQIRIYTDTGEIVDSLEYQRSWGGVDVALERKSLIIASTLASNWGDSPNSLFGTPGLPNEIESDTEPPTLISHTLPNPSTLYLIFSETLASATALNQANYSFTEQSISISDINYNDTDTVFIELSQSLSANTNYTLNITDIDDVFGNTLSDTTITVNYLEFAQIDSGDVFITEFLYDPFTGAVEFIELFNKSNKFLNLADLTLNDQTSSRNIISTSDKLFVPGSYLVLSPDNSLNTLFPDIEIHVMDSRFTTLNNSGDRIVIRRSDGLLIDSLSYTSVWGGSKVSLERRSTDISAAYLENWGDSPSPQFATPGKINDISPDTQPPSVIFTDVSKQLIIIRFSERIESISEVVLNPSINFSHQIKNDSLIISTTAPLQSGQPVTVTMTSVTDLFGNRTTLQKEVIWFDIATIQPGNLIINEFFYKNSIDIPEYVEFYNTTSNYLSLKGLRFSDNMSEITLNEIQPFLEKDMIISPSGYIVITADPQFAFTTPNAVAVSSLPTLNDTGGDAIVLKNSGLLIDSLSYDSNFWPNPTSTESLERKDPMAASNDPSNWIVSQPSPGIRNFNYIIDIDPPTALFSGFLSPDTITVVYNEFITLSNESAAAINGVNVSILGNQNQNLFIDGSAISTDTELLLTLEFISDMVGNQTDLTTKPVSVAMDQVESKPQISEILYDDLNTPDARQSEFIEIYNPSQNAVILPNPPILRYSTTSQKSQSISYKALPFPAVVPARSWAVFYADTALWFSQSRIAAFFELTDSSRFFQIKGTTLSLSSETTNLLLINENNAVIDSVPYRANWNNPNIPNTKGRSLERVSSKSSGYEKSNWTTSAAINGATPGERNSVSVDEIEPESENSITLSPNPFSPDEDGFEDNLTISYLFDSPNYLLTIRIFDRYGRQVRLLTDNKPAGIEGTVIWDGFRDDGTRNRIGIYVVLVRVYDASTGKEKMFKKSVVLARKL